LIKNIVTYCLTFLCSAIVVDAYLGKSGAISLSEYQFYPEFGLGYRTFSNQILFNEGFSIKSYDSNKLYATGAEKENEKTIKIALLGDSYVKADQVFDRHYFGNVLKDKLHTDKKIQVINYGYNGSELSQMYVTHQTQANLTNPSLILYFIANSDLKPMQYNDVLLPLLTETKTGVEISSNFPDETAKSYLINAKIKQNSSITNLVINAIKNYRINGILPALFGKLYSHSMSNTPKKINSAKQKLAVPRITQEIIKNLRGKNVVFVNRTIDRLPSSFYELLDTNGIKHIELSSVFESLKNNNIEPHFWKASNQNGHWNKKTHEAIGKHLAIECDKILNTIEQNNKRPLHGD
jgi:hypothetical protein